MKRMWSAVWVGLMVCMMIPYAHAGKLGFLEEFVLAKDRSKVLKQLIPGTRDYYYYHALHYQNLGKTGKVKALLKLWKKKHRWDSRRKEIEHRQALLAYSKNPQETLKYLRKKLYLRFYHRRRVAGQKSTLPNAFDQKKISRATLMAKGLKRYSYNLYPFESSALYWLAEKKLNPKQRRRLLNRLKNPDIPNLVPMIIADLKYSHGRSFGSAGIHSKLTLKQLEACLKLRPSLLKSSTFVNTYLTKLKPGADVDIRTNRAAHLAYLNRLWDFVKRLPAAQNSLKLHVYYHILKYDHEDGTYDKLKFLEYVKIPRYATYINNKYISNHPERYNKANRYKTYGSTALPRVGNDEPLIRAYLSHYFVKETTTQPYEWLLRKSYLKTLFAKTKILNGIGNQEKWFAMLSPAANKALKKRVDIDFAASNKKYFKPSDDVVLDVYLKNIKNLLVKVYEINTDSVYRQSKKGVKTDVQLDGLVANSEKVYKYTFAPFRRHKQTFTFKTMKKRGVYVIDFIGNGKNSRVLVQKGRLQYVVRTSVAGQAFRILDEDGKPAPNASLWLGGKTYKPRKNGEIIVPFTNRPGRVPVILKSGSFVSLDHVSHESETYNFYAGLYVDRESLIKRKKATVIVRPSLFLNGTPVTMKILKNTTLKMTSVDRFGVRTSTTVNNFALHGDRESTHTFRVPENLSSLSFVLTTHAKNVSKNKEQTFTKRHSVKLNQIDRTVKLAAFHLLYGSDQYTAYLLDRVGRPIPNTSVYVKVKHRDFRRNVYQTLQTGAFGQIELGELQDIAWLEVRASGLAKRRWYLRQDRQVISTTWTTSVGRALYIPYTGELGKDLHEEFSLFALKGGSFAEDVTDQLKFAPGYVKIDDLPAGDYKLFLKRRNMSVSIHIVKGAKVDDHVVGQKRILSLSRSKPVQILATAANKKAFDILVANATKRTRIHVIATRFFPEYNVYRALAKTGSESGVWRTVSPLKSHYRVGRDIGDEYRYILERKNAQKWVGNMLTRPSLLLNPWAISKTTTKTLDGKGGGGFGTSGRGYGGGGRRAYGRGGMKLREGRLYGEVKPNLDFLPEGSVVLSNLKPDAKGKISIPLKTLAGHQHVHVIAIDEGQTLYRQTSIDGTSVNFVDLRLRNGLDPKKHFTEQKQVDILPKGKAFVLKDITTSTFKTYDSLQKVHALFAALNSNQHMRTFSFLLKWPTYKAAKKRELYSKYACHELNFFLYKKDPAFFKAVIRGYIANKRDKTFMDHYLTGGDLSKYVKPWAFKQLNIVEKILLGQVVKSEIANIQRYVSDKNELLRKQLRKINMLFETALKVGALSGGGKLGDLLLDARKKIRLAAEEKSVKSADKPSASTISPSAAPAPKVLGDFYGKLKKKLRRRRARRRYNKNFKYEMKKDAPSDDEPSEQRNDSDLTERKRQRQFYRKLEKAKEYAENNYYKLTVYAQNANLVKVNDFWKDYATYKGDAFISRHVAKASKNFTEMMFALSVLDLPFKSPTFKADFKGSQMTLKLGAQAIVYHKSIQQAKPSTQKTPILVSQNFFQYGRRYTYKRGKRIDRYVRDEFVKRKVYGCQIVVTNPTSSRQKLDLLMQIPHGAVPVLNGRYTKSKTINLRSYRTKLLTYYFYFPDAGTYAHYPVHISTNGQLLTFAKVKTFKVVDKPTKTDKTTWEYISQNGTDKQILDYLASHNVHRLNLSRVAWKVRKSASFYKALMAHLRSRHVYNSVLFGYAVKYNDAENLRVLLRHRSSFVNRCGMYLKSPLLNIDPVERKRYQHLEYWPLVNERAHKFGSERKIANNKLFAQYTRLMGVLKYRASFDQDELMALTYYLLLQDRVPEALAFFKRVDGTKLATKLQYDYFRVYFDFFTEKPLKARAIAEKYKAYPVKRWRQFFTSALRQLDEIEGKIKGKVVNKKDRTEQQTDDSTKVASFDFGVESKKVTITFQNVKTFKVNYYLMDIELLFSRKPFVQKHTGRFSYIRPNLTQMVKAKGNKLSFALPKRFHNSNVMIEISAEGIKKSKAYYAHSLNAMVIEQYGQVRITHADTNKALSKVYIKVYARMKNGTVRFYKDGYTDLRGRFDYTSLNTNAIDHVSKFSILILSKQHGAIVREANPPKQ
ncbi:MAG: hypothetical protein CL920_20875 [Deltaproteobacteria bacterium]|nr:hypothetical protein [Deltaproteobacteria bacterium]